MIAKGICEDLYSKVRPVLENESVDLNIRKMLACQYVSFMCDIQSGKKGISDLRKQYREIIILIEEG